MKKFLDWLLKRERKLFVSYMLQSKNGPTAYTHGVYHHRGLVSNFHDIATIAAEIKSMNPGCDSVVIISMQLLPI